MKQTYEKPIVSVESLTKTDVLCSSAPSDRDNQFVQSDGLLEYVFSGDW
jgi:hypothetical protein